MMRRIAQILILLFIAVMVTPAFLSNQIEASAQKDIALPAGVIYEDFNNLNKFSKWEPWASADSLSTQEFFSPYKGKGAGYKWETDGNSGILTITKTEKDKKVEYSLEGFGLGKDSEMTVELVPIDSANTTVKWNIKSKKISYFSRYYTYFTSGKLADVMNTGLERLEKFLSASAMTEEQADSLQPGMIGTEQFEGQKLISVLNETTFDQSEIITATEESFGLIHSYLVDFLKIPKADIGNPVSYFDYIDSASKEAKFHSGYPIIESVKLGEGMELVSIPASTALICTHKGSYSTITKTIDEMKAYAKSKNLKLESFFWEEFQNSPKEVKDENELLTKIYIPTKEE